jgi:hypothetical protein
MLSRSKERASNKEVPDALQCRQKCRAPERTRIKNRGSVLSFSESHRQVCFQALHRLEGDLRFHYLALPVILTTIDLQANNNEHAGKLIKGALL